VTFSAADPIVHDLQVMADAVNYRRWIFSHIGGHIGNRVVELGAGIGNMTELMSDRELVVAVDNHRPCIEFMKDRFSGSLNIMPLEIDISGGLPPELVRFSPDTIVCINVLEHLADDAGVLDSMFRVLGESGSLVLVVPAFSFLFGSIDRVVGHYRRYGKKELRSKLTAAGFSVSDLFYMNSLGVAGWFLNNRVLKLGAESTAQVKVYDRLIVPWLSRLEAAIRPPFGMSLIALAGKDQGR